MDATTVGEGNEWSTKAFFDDLLFFIAWFVIGRLLPRRLTPIACLEARIASILNSLKKLTDASDGKSWRSYRHWNAPDMCSLKKNLPAEAAHACQSQFNGTEGREVIGKQMPH
jgi:hypothetical protein